MLMSTTTIWSRRRRTRWPWPGGSSPNCSATAGPTSCWPGAAASTAWDGRCWREWDEATIRAEAYRFLEHAKYLAMGINGPEHRPWEPTRSKIANVLEALRAVTHLAETIEPPAWLEGEGPDPRELW